MGVLAELQEFDVEGEVAGRGGRGGKEEKDSLEGTRGLCCSTRGKQERSDDLKGIAGERPRK